MPDLPSRVDLFNIGRAYVLQRAKKIDPAQVDYEGSDANLIVGGQSVLADHVVKHLGFRTAALTLDGCETDDDLDRYAWDRYQELRKGASPARTDLQITRPTAVAGGGDIPIGTRCVTATGVEYVTYTVATMGASSLSTSARVRAVEAGKLTQVGKNEIVRFASPGELWDPTLVCTNAEAAAGGEDVEDFDTFKDRLRNFWRTARRGILAAIELGATSVAGVVSAQAIEVVNADGDAARLVQLFIADSSGVASDALAYDVRVALGDFRAGGIQVLVYTSLPQLVEIVLRLTFAANVDTLSLTTQIRSSIVAYVNSLRANEKLLRADLMSVLTRFKEDGLVVDDGTLVSPTGDLVPDVGQTIRTTPELVVVS